MFESKGGHFYSEKRYITFENNYIIHTLGDLKIWKWKKDLKMSWFEYPPIGGQVLKIVNQLIRIKSWNIVGGNSPFEKGVGGLKDLSNRKQIITKT